MGAQQPRTASCSLSVSPYITTRRCNSPAGPGLGPHKTSSSRPASNLAHFNIRQIWTISTPVNRHFPFYFHHTTTVSSRQPFLCPHERSTCYVFWFTPDFQPFHSLPSLHPFPTHLFFYVSHTFAALFTVHPRTGPQPGRPVHSDTVYTAALTRTHDALALHHGTGPALSSHL